MDNYCTYTLDVNNRPLDVTDIDVCMYETEKEYIFFRLNLYPYYKSYYLDLKILNSIKYYKKFNNGKDQCTIIYVVRYAFFFIISFFLLYNKS